MKKLLLASLVSLSALVSFSEPTPADEILAFVRTKLPSDPLKLTGTLKVRTKNGFTKTTLPVTMELDWGSEKPTARYQIGEESLTIHWVDDQPRYTFSQASNTPTSNILGTGLSWADLSFSVLWWPQSQLIDEEKKMNRTCYVVEVPVPHSDKTMRLWIEKKMGMLLEAQTLNAQQKMVSRLKIKSIKKMDGMWVAKDLELLDKQTGNKTLLQITDLEWKNPKPTATVTAFDPAESINQLAFDLYDALAAQTEGNLFFSPYSISAALAMTYGGARGETAEQMNATLHFGGQGATHPALAYLRKNLNHIQQTGDVQLSIANSLWPQKDYALRPDYLALTQEFYGSEIQSVDYQTDTEGARQTINRWVEAQTQARIQDLIPEGMLAPHTRLVLANAIYFKGNWARQFKPEYTRDGPFTLADGTVIETSMMSQTGDFKWAHTPSFQALELPYEGGDLSMIILLPNESTPLEKLDWTTLDALEFREMEVRVQLPKFKLESTFTLSSILAHLGMPQAFTPQADFSGMDGSHHLFIGEVIHKAFVEIDEAGTEAAAATAVGMRLTSMPPQFVANRPFIFLIRENQSGTLLFVGRVAHPTR